MPTPRPVAGGGAKGGRAPTKAECPLANDNRLQRNVGWRNVIVYVKMIEDHLKSKDKKEDATV
jgi:hypothetical protein